MDKYLVKKIDDVEPVFGFNKIESAILSENGYTDLDVIKKDFPDLFDGKREKITDFLKAHSKLKNTDKFIEIVKTFKEKKICIIGDYDADGIMGTSIMRIAMGRLGYNVFHIIPDRLKDGFALKTFHVDKVLEGGASLLIMVDNGTSAHEAVAYAKEKGLTVIITDHHLPDKNLGLPMADLVVNPHVNGDEFEDICGAIVSLKVSFALLEDAGMIDSRLNETLFVMGAIATIGDMMHLKGENRYIVKTALNSMNRIRDNNTFNQIGKILAGMADINYMSVYSSEKLMTEEALAYYVCPVINATGRVYGDVNKVVSDIIDAEKDGFYLYGYKETNKERKFRTKEIAKKHKPNKKPVDVTIINESDFTYAVNGLTGLLANRISNSENKPCFVGYRTVEDSMCRLSGRTVNGYSIYDAAQRIKALHPELQIEGGGHDGAIGLSMDISVVPQFEELICDDYGKFEGSEEIPSVYTIESNMIGEAIESHKRFAPFGEGWKKILFKYSGKLERKIEAINTIIVGDYEFKVYTLLSNVPEIGTNVDIYFSISLGERQYAEFKMEDIIERA